MAAARIAAATLSGSRIDARAVCQPRLDRYSRESVLWLGMPSVLHAASKEADKTMLLVISTPHSFIYDGHSNKAKWPS